MTYQVKRLVEGFPRIVGIGPDEPLSKVVELMLDNDFSQIPVVDDDNQNYKPIGIITTDDVLQAMEDFHVPVSELIAHNVMRPPKIANIEDDLFDLFDKVLEDGAVIIIQENGWVDSIVTSSDIVDFFKQQTIESLYLEDIESSMKEIILYCFMDDEDMVDSVKLTGGIDSIHSSLDSIKQNFRKAVGIYLSETNSERKIDYRATERAFESLGFERRQKNFEDLSFNELIMLLTSPERWEFYQPIFKINSDAVRIRLENVRDIRNQLAHYRGELTSTQRKLLRSTREWISRCQTEYEEWREQKRSKEILASPTEVEVEKSPVIEEIIPVEDDITTTKYSPLASYLRKQPTGVNKIKLTFDEVEAILGTALPPSAYTSRSWWANDSVGHVQSKEWLDAGWRVGYRNLSAKTVDFSRMRNRDKKYIDFFASILKSLRDDDQVPVKDTSSPLGDSWITICGVVVNGAQKSIIVTAFASGNRYRIELYIDTGDKETNKKIFDELHQSKNTIESEIGAELGWERISDKRACRIALYTDGAITMSEEDLSQLKYWTIENFPIFYKALHDRSVKVIENVLDK